MESERRSRVEGRAVLRAVAAAPTAAGRHGLLQDHADSWKRALCAALGAAPVAESSFHPFFREIVSVDESDDADEPPTVIDER
jgi:hypothetical protein